MRQNHLSSTGSKRILIAALAGVGMTALSAQAATWVETASGTYNWQDDTKWNPSYPDAAGAVADVTADIAGNVTIQLNADRTLGTLNLGDSGTSGSQSNYTFSGGSPARSLIFEGASAGAPTALNLTGTATSTTNVINANVQLGGSSSMTINQLGPQALRLGGTTNLNGNTLGTAGGGSGDLTIGQIIGTGAIIKNNTGALYFNSNSNSYTGSLTLNKGTTNVNSTSSISTFGSVTINGALGTDATVPLGGRLTIGNNSGTGTNPGQRLPLAGVTLNGGILRDTGQALNGAAANTMVLDNMATLDFNSGYSRFDIMAASTSGGTTLNITTLQRGDGATASVTGQRLAGTANGTNAPNYVFITNIAGFLKGASGTGTSQSIIPWMTANNTNPYGVTVSDWATYGPNGLVALSSSDYKSMSLASTTDNVKDTAAVGNNTSKTINSLIMTASSGSNIGTNSTLTVSSGAVLITANNGGIGVAGNAAAGTLNMGSAEGVIWSIGSNTNYIGSMITGSGGLTKAGTGTLVLQGANTLTGDTFVSAGILRVGDGTRTSSIGDGNVSVANGATLWISSADIITDTATLSIDQYGLLNGMVKLDAGIDETVGGLLLGGVAQAAGTYGSTSSAATFQNDQYFSGSGILTVVPEPTSAGVLAIGGLLLAARRRHR